MDLGEIRIRADFKAVYLSSLKKAAWLWRWSLLAGAKWSTGYAESWT